MSASGEYYSYYVAHDYLAHHGVLGMKWGQHIFGKGKSSGNSRRHRSATEQSYVDAKNFHDKEVPRRKKMSATQAHDELKRMSLYDPDDKLYDTSNEVRNLIWNYDRDLKTKASKEIKSILDRTDKLYADRNAAKPEDIKRINDLIERNETKVDKIVSRELGYAYSPEAGEYLRDLWKWD